jgi:hypothetical protein
VRRLIAFACLIQTVYADTPSEFAKCAGIENAAERLKCYDATADRLGFGLPPPPREPVTRSEDYGKPPPPRASEVKELTAMVVEFSKTPRGRAVFVLDNGQTWRQLDADTAEVREPESGRPMRVSIETGAFGSYNLAIEGRAGAVKVRRLK